jgi:transcriptional regulator with XRE-family HTH domain
MHAAGLNGLLVAEQLGVHQSTISLMLSGKHSPNSDDLAATLAVCGVTGRERNDLLRLGRVTHQLNARARKHLDTYADNVADARRVTEFQSAVVPEILQTADYARVQLAATGRLTPDEVEQAVTARTDRAVLLDRDELPTFRFFLHEWLLRTPVGGHDTMSDQLHHLLRMSVLPDVSVRIVPIVAGALPVQSGPFGFLDFIHHQPVVHRPEEDADVYIEEPDEIRVYRDIVTRLDALALDEKQSRAVIGEAATTLWT